MAQATGYSYTPIQYDEDKYRKGIDTSFYQKAVSDYTADAEKNRAKQLASASKTREDSLREAYVQNQQDKSNLAKTLATSGIRGGATESSNIKLASNYGANRNAANSTYADNVNTINQNVDSNITDYRQNMESRAEEYRQNLAQSKWQADREDSINNQNAVVDYWTNYYNGTLAGVSKESKLTKLRDETNAQFTKAQAANNTSEMTRLQQKLAAIGLRLSALRGK